MVFWTITRIKNILKVSAALKYIVEWINLTINYTSSFNVIAYIDSIHYIKS